MAVDILFDEANHRAVAKDGNEEIGQITFGVTKDGSAWNIDHTGVEKAYGGQGIARRLVDEVVKAARERDVKLSATCSYADRVFKDSDTYDDVLLKK